MRIEWINKKDDNRVVVFFNGWGMDAAAVAHMTAECDLLMCYDYRRLEEAEFPSLIAYREVIIVAWSMGVWAAANSIQRLDVHPIRWIALNGTEHPVDDRWGIPARIYGLTEKGMNEQGRAKFMQRMFGSREEAERFCTGIFVRTLEDVREELSRIRIQSAELTNELTWDVAYVSEGDVIFPPVNQRVWWDKQGIPVKTFPGGHYPFAHFRRWEEIIAPQ